MLTSPKCLQRVNALALFLQKPKKCAFSDTEFAFYSGIWPPDLFQIAVRDGTRQSLLDTLVRYPGTLADLWKRFSANTFSNIFTRLTLAKHYGAPSNRPCPGKWPKEIACDLFKIYANMEMGFEYSCTGVDSTIVQKLMAEYGYKKPFKSHFSLIHVGAALPGLYTKQLSVVHQLYRPASDLFENAHIADSDILILIDVEEDHAQNRPGNLRLVCFQEPSSF